MKARGHYYRTGMLGRSIATLAGQGGTSFVARLQCSNCPAVGERKLRAIMPPDQIDRKFQQLGWAIDPHICPECLSHTYKERSKMSAKPSPDAMRAQAQMITLLQTHFNVERGAFTKDWDDARVASTTGIAKPLVIEYREACFGPLKEPPELAAIRADIASLERLHQESVNSFTVEVASLRSRLGDLSKKWTA